MGMLNLGQYNPSNNGMEDLMDTGSDLGMVPGMAPEQMPQQGGGGSGLFSNLRPMQMAGILMMSGVPMDRAMSQVASMQEHQRSQQMQDFKYQMLIQKYMQGQEVDQKNKELFNMLIGNDNTGYDQSLNNDVNGSNISSSNPNYTLADTLRTSNSDTIDANDANASVNAPIPNDIKIEASMLAAKGEYTQAAKLIREAKASQQKENIKAKNLNDKKMIDQAFIDSILGNGNDYKDSISTITPTANTNSSSSKSSNPTLATVLNNQSNINTNQNLAGVGANAPTAMPTQMPSSNNSLFGNVDPQTRKMAALLFASGDKSGALKMLNDAKTLAQTQAIEGGFQKDPRMGPARGGQGGTYVNPTNGGVISTDTMENTTTDQRTIAALQRVAPQVERLMQVLPQFQHANTNTQAFIQGLSNTYLGTDYRLPSEKAEGHAILNAAPESLLKAYGLNVTDDSMKSMRAMIEPGKGESPEGYRDRLTRNLAEMQMFGDQAKVRLANGNVLKAATGTNVDMKDASTDQIPSSQTNMENNPSIGNKDILNQLLAEKQRRTQLRANGKK